MALMTERALQHHLAAAAATVRILDMPFEARTVANALREQAARSGTAPWLIFDDESLSFAEVDQLVDVYAAALVRLGLGLGDRIGLLAGNSKEFVLVAIASARLGVTIVPINTANRGESLRYVIATAGLQTIFCDDEHCERLRELQERGQLRDVQRIVLLDTGECPSFGNIDGIPLTAALAGGAPLPELPQVDTRGAWTVLFTSGTTGRSKGAVMTHQYWYIAPRSLCAGREVCSDDVFYVSSPLFHAAAWLVQILPSLLLGLPVAIDKGFSRTDFWNRVRKFGATQLLTMGATHMWLWNEPPSSRDADNPARVWAPVPLPPELEGPFRARFGVKHLWQTYGGTEFMSVTFTDVGRPAKPGSSGWPREGVQLMVADEFDRPLPADVVGELCVRPTVPHAIFEGYLNDSETTLHRMRNLWYHTGDLVRIDGDGELFFVDRKDDYLRVRGENVSSFEVEAVFMAHPSVLEAAAHTVQDETTKAVAEDEIKVCVVLNEGHRVTPEQLIAHAARELPRFAVPRYIEVLIDLPRTATGRVQKHVLRDRGITSTTWIREAPISK
jgi:carnitine-CoA ligase